MANEKANQWTQVQKAIISNQVNKSKGKGGNAGKGINIGEKKSLNPQAIGNASVSSNPFVVLSSAEEYNSPILEEG